MKRYIFALILVLPGIMRAMEQTSLVETAHEKLAAIINSNPHLHLTKAIKEHDADKVAIILDHHAFNINFQGDDSVLAARMRMRMWINVAVELEALYKDYEDVYNGNTHLCNAIKAFRTTKELPFEKRDEATRQQCERVLRLILDRKNVNPHLGNISPLALAIDPHFSVRALEILLEYHDTGRFKIPLDLNIRLPETIILGDKEENLTPLFYALEQRNWPAVFLLVSRDDVDTTLAKQVDVFRKTNGYSALHLLAHCFEHTLHAMGGLPVGKVPLHFNEILHVIFRLIERGVYINQTYEENVLVGEKTPIDMAIQNDIRFLIRTFCAFGARTLNPKSRSYRVWRSLPEIQAQEGLFCLLWRNNWRVATCDTFSNVCVTISAINEALAAGATLASRCPLTLLTPCMILAALGQVPLLREIIQAHGTMDVNALATHNWTALHFAAYNGNGEMVKLLLCNPAIIPTPKTVTGLTPFRLALIGNVARARANAHTKDTAIPVLAEFNKCRLTLLMSLKAWAQSAGITIPGDIFKILVNAYRFADAPIIDTPSDQHVGSTESIANAKNNHTENAAKDN